ncbi:MAG: YebC/PmpR family DNA-binding transcriptional regulator [Anaerohalosphaeraceae bacterium]|nr:YebC/PmpR family DNA-binding transcriptional regulator [Anaerohalosphaeraceae bacterium]
MSGHSHWAGIKHKKAANDAKRGKIWSKIARQIIVAAKSGGGDPGQNLALRYAIDEAKQANMPKDTIEKAIKKGTGEGSTVAYESVLYEGYAPGGIAIMAEALTDNRARTGPEVKKIFEKHGGSLGNSGCVSYMFSKKGLIAIVTSAIDEDELMELALNAGADDMENTDEIYELSCSPQAYDQLRKAITDKEIAIEASQISMVPENSIEITDPEAARKIMNLVDAFEDHDDVQKVYANFDISDEIMEKLD